MIFRNTVLGSVGDVSINLDMSPLITESEDTGENLGFAENNQVYNLKLEGTTLHEIVKKKGLSFITVKGSLVAILEYGDSTVYLIGTNHASALSRSAVVELIRNVEPHVVMNEHDDSREGLTDSKIFTGNRYYNLDLLYDSIEENGFLAGMIWFALAYGETLVTVLYKVNYGGDMSAPRRLQYEMQVTSENLLTAPRSRAGRIKNFDIVFGDRPIKITLKRMGLALNFFRKALVTLCVTCSTFFGYRLGLIQVSSVLFSSNNFKKVLLDERDLYLTYSLQETAKLTYNEPTRVVGIVGAAHMPGIIKNWGKVTEQQIAEITQV